MKLNLSYSLQLLFCLIILIISIYCLSTKDFMLLPISLAFVGFSFLLIGLREWRRAKKSVISILSFGTAIFILLIVGQSLFG